MRQLLNMVQLTGRAGWDPELKDLGNNKKLLRISVAIDESYIDKRGDKIPKTNWQNLVFWDKLAEIAKNQIKKGDKIIVVGKLKTTAYQDKNGENKIYQQVEVQEFHKIAV